MYILHIVFGFFKTKNVHVVTWTLESDTSVCIWAEECMLKVNTSTWEDLLVKRAGAAKEHQEKKIRSIVEDIVL